MSTSRDVKIIAHGIVASIGMLLLTPMAILIARFLRGHTWLPSHKWINLSSAILVVIGCALGAWVGDGPDNGKQQSMSWWTHNGVGVAIGALAVIQVVVGWWAHKTQGNPRQSPTYQGPRQSFETARSKSFVRKGHMLLGILFIILGDGQVWSGFALWPVKSSKGTAIPSWLRIIYWILVAGFAILYVVGWLFEAIPRKGSRSEKQLYGNNGNEDAVPLSPSYQPQSYPFNQPYAQNDYTKAQQQQPQVVDQSARYETYPAPPATYEHPPYPPYQYPTEQRY